MSESQIAKRVINESLRVKEDDEVVINTWHHTIDAANAIALEAYKVGAIPTITLYTDDLALDYYTNVPEQYYSKAPRAYLAMLDHADAVIDLGGPEDPGLYQKASGEKLAKALEYYRIVNKKLREKKIPTINLPTGTLTAKRAASYGFNLDKWRQVTNNALDVDLEKIRVLANTFGSKLRKGRKVRVTTPAGTDLSFSIEGRPVHVHDGIIDEEDLSHGTNFEYLPSGIVDIPVVETSAEGTVTFDKPNGLRGKMIKRLRLRFENGKITSMEAEENLEALKDLYDGAVGPKDRMGSFAIGLNPRMQYMGFYYDSLIQGAASIGIGQNMEIGGKNDTAFGYSQTLTDATVELDGNKIILDGKINL